MHTLQRDLEQRALLDRPTWRTATLLGVAGFLAGAFLMGGCAHLQAWKEEQVRKHEDPLFQAL